MYNPRGSKETLPNTFAGRLISVELRCRIEPVTVSRGKSTREGLLYHYEVPGVHADKDGMAAVEMHPDVALKPWSGDVSGRHTETVIRVPCVEGILKKSWTANCDCLLVNENKLRSLVLCLGASLREPGAFEKVGIIDGCQLVSRVWLPLTLLLEASSDRQHIRHLFGWSLLVL